MEAGGSLDGEELSDLWTELFATYRGDTIKTYPDSRYQWTQVPHFYYDYYVYQYATGYAAAIALSQSILNEGTPAVADYLGFLSGGCSKPPIELLRGAGVDMATPAPGDAALGYFAELIEELEGLVG